MNKMLAPYFKGDILLPLKKEDISEEFEEIKIDALISNGRVDGVNLKVPSPHLSANLTFPIFYNRYLFYPVCNCLSCHSAVGILAMYNKKFILLCPGLSCLLKILD